MNLMEVIGAFAPGGTTVALQEAAYDGSDYYDPDMTLGAVQGGSLYYRRLTQSPSDLSPITHERMQQMALYLYDRNPLAKRCLELIKDFVVGEGFQLASKDKELQAAIDRFWEDGQNDLDQRLHALTLELGLWGEQLYAAFVHGGSGHVRIVSIDPRTIGEVIPDPTNSDLAYAVRLKGPIGTDSKYLKVIRENDDGRLVGAEPDEEVRLPNMAKGTSIRYYDPLRGRSSEVGGSGALTGEIGAMDQTRLVGCFYFSVNKVQGSTRGRSDLLAVADLLDLYDRLIFDEAERMSFMRAHIYDVTIKGGTPQQIVERAAAEAPPAPGTVKFHNDSEIWAAVSPDLKAQDGATTADLILSLIATGVGLPKTWLNGIMDINRASAMSMDGPSLKRLRTRQLYVQGIVRRMVTFALDQSSLAGGVAAPDDSGYDFAIESPEMSHKDLQTGSAALTATAQALGMSQAAGWIDPDTAQQAISIMLSQIGVNVDADELKVRVDAHKKKQQDEQTTQDQSRIPAYFGMGASAGNDSLNRALGGAGATPGGPPAPTGGAPGAPPASTVPGAPPPSGPAFVPLSPRDIPAAFAQMSTGLVSLGNAGVIDAELAQEVVRQLLSGIGVQVDIEAMQARIDDQQQEDEQKQQEQLDAQAAAAPPPPTAGPAGRGAPAQPVPARAGPPRPPKPIG